MKRRYRSVAALAALCLSLAGSARPEEDATPIIRKAFEAAKANEAMARNYVFHERIEERRFDPHGAEKKRESKTWDVTLFDGSDYRRLIARDDQPLDRAAAAREQRRLEKHIRKLQNETPRQRAQRLARVEKDRQEGEEFLEEITRAFDFRLIGGEEIGGTLTHVISAEPKPGYEPPSRMTRALTKVRATLWVSQEDHAWVQADMETFDDFTWLAVLKLRSGARIRFKQQQLNEEVWVTETWNVRYRARIAFVYGLDSELTGTYSNFRRFTADATVTGWTLAD